MRHQSFKRFLTESTAIPIQTLTYEQYCEALDVAFSLQEDDTFTFSGLASDIKTFIQSAKEALYEIAKMMQLAIVDLVEAFKSRKVYQILKAFKFSLGMMIKSLMAIDKLVEDGLLLVFKELAKSGVIEELKKGTIKVDAVLDKHPILKRVTGLSLFGLLLWLDLYDMGGGIDYNLDYTPEFSAALGHYTISDMLLSPEQLQFLVFVAIGAAVGIRILWLSDPVNLCAAILYTGWKQRRIVKPVVVIAMKKIKSAAKTGTVKIKNIATVNQNLA